MNRARVEIDLFVCGALTERSETTMRNLSSACRRRYGTDYVVNVIDVIDTPGVAERANVIATPTIIIRRPLPGCRMVGDLTAEPDAVGWPV